MLDALHAKGFDDLEPHHLPVLQYPGPDGLRPSDLAARHPDDLRSRRIALTARGRAIVPVIRNAVRRTERAWAAQLGEERLEQLRSILTELRG